MAELRSWTLELLHGQTDAKVSEVSALLAELHRESQYGRFQFDAEKVRTEVAKRLEGVGDLFCLARCGGLAVGLLHANAVQYGITDRWFVRVDYLYVSPPYRGRGMAEELVHFALQRADIIAAPEVFFAFRGSEKPRSVEAWIQKRFGATHYGGQFAQYL